MTQKKKNRGVDKSTEQEYNADVFIFFTIRKQYSTADRMPMEKGKDVFCVGCYMKDVFAFSFIENYVL